MMSSKESLKDVSTHFDFGQNWSKYAQSLSEQMIGEAQEGLVKLVPADALVGSSFLDIGCGSGLHSLAALRLGARPLVAMDIDPDSAATTVRVLAKYAAADAPAVVVGSVFDAPFAPEPGFDIVYSWGVLHHTGSMWEAIQKAAELVKPGGLLVIAIYLKTPFCGFWKREKRLFTKLPEMLRLPIVGLYSSLCILRLLLKGVNPLTHIRQYKQHRGMSWYRDRIDWLGGYPYESASAAEVTEFVGRLGGSLQQSFGTKPSIGLLSSGCAEYVFRMHPGTTDTA